MLGKIEWQAAREPHKSQVMAITCRRSTQAWSVIRLGSAREDGLEFRSLVFVCLGTDVSEPSGSKPCWNVYRGVNAK